MRRRREGGVWLVGERRKENNGESGENYMRVVKKEP